MLDRATGIRDLHSNLDLLAACICSFLLGYKHTLLCDQLLSCPFAPPRTREFVQCHLTESFSLVSVINSKLVLWRRINSLTSSILGARDMIFASIIVGTLGVHTGLVTRVVLILSITMQLFVLLLAEVSF